MTGIRVCRSLGCGRSVHSYGFGTLLQVSTVGRVSILELVPLDDLCPMDEVATRLRALLKWAIQLFRRAYNTDIARVQGSSVGQLPSRRILKLHLATIDLGCIRSDPSLGNSLLETIKVTTTSTSWVQWASDLHHYWLPPPGLASLVENSNLDYPRDLRHHGCRHLHSNHVWVKRIICKNQSQGYVGPNTGLLSSWASGPSRELLRQWARFLCPEHLG